MEDFIKRIHAIRSDITFKCTDGDVRAVRTLMMTSGFTFTSMLTGGGAILIWERNGYGRDIVPHDVCVGNEIVLQDTMDQISAFTDYIQYNVISDNITWLANVLLICTKYGVKCKDIKDKFRERLRFISWNETPIKMVVAFDMLYPYRHAWIDICVRLAAHVCAYACYRIFEWVLDEPNEYSRWTLIKPRLHSKIPIPLKYTMTLDYYSKKRMSYTRANLGFVSDDTLGIMLDVLDWASGYVARDHVYNYILNDLECMMRVKLDGMDPDIGRKIKDQLNTLGRPAGIARRRNSI